VAQPISTISRGTKRARRSSVLPLSENDRVIGKLSHVTSANSKRARISMPSGTRADKRPIAKMTKAEVRVLLH
jgi:hypothetical protein